MATLIPDLTVLASVEPDDARNRCRYVSSHFGVGVGWMSRDTERVARGLAAGYLVEVPRG